MLGAKKKRSFYSSVLLLLLLYRVSSGLLPVLRYQFCVMRDHF